MAATSIWLRGPGPARPEPIELVCGAWRAEFEPDSGWLRYVRAGSVEAVRAVYAAVRDHNWDTIEPVIRDLRIDQRSDGFVVEFVAQHRQGPIDFVWSGRLEGSPDAIRYTFDGQARSTFRRNRIGFCLLHPMACAGQPVTIEKVDGTLQAGHFPDAISPHQPFWDIRAIRHELAPGLVVDVRTEGDTFEMEDQRNWTDASFKTYCTPLAEPFPVEVSEGTRIVQSVTMAVHGTWTPYVPPSDARPATVAMSLDELSYPLPRLGVATASHCEPLSERQAARLRQLRLAHLRAEVRLHEPSWPEQLERALGQSAALDLPLEAAVVFDDDAPRQLDALLDHLQLRQPRVARWLAFHAREKSTSDRWIQVARERLARYQPQVPVGSGTLAYFTELNRQRPAAALLDWFGYSVNPQVHAFDEASIVETLAAQAETVRSARVFSGGKPVSVGPVTLRPRFNPNATGAEPAPPAGELPSQVDARQSSLLAAGWTLGSIKYLAVGAAGAATYYETTGWRGVIELDGGSPLPDRFPSVPGGVFPLYHVLADVGQWRDAALRPWTSSEPLRAEALRLERPGKRRILLAQFTPRPLEVLLRGLVGRWQMRRLDEQTVERAMAEPESYRAGQGEVVAAGDAGLALELSPWAVACLDQEE